jgi:hypothetical protein
MTENKETKYGFTEVGISFTVASNESIASLQKGLEEAWKGWFAWQREIHGLSEPKKEGDKNVHHGSN